MTADSPLASSDKSLAEFIEVGKTLAGSADLSYCFDLDQPLKAREMKRLLLLALLVASGAAQAGIPLLNATCPGKIEVHADEGGPIYINGKEGKLKKFNENYFEAKASGVTISLSINPDGSPSVSYTGRNRANGICQVKAQGS